MAKHRLSSRNCRFMIMKTNIPLWIKQKLSYNYGKEKQASEEFLRRINGLRG